MASERFIHHLRVERPLATETAAEARERLRDKFPRAALRRMTHLGMLLGSTLDGVALGPADALVYATTYAETRALEDFLQSFPGASPMLFQTSIHPGGMQQVLIGRQQPIARLWPLAGRLRIVEQAMTSVLLESADTVALAGGEEQGTWLLERHMASARAFAFGAILTREESGAIGRVCFTPSEESRGNSDAFSRGDQGGDSHDEPCPTLEVFVEALAERRGLVWRSTVGQWKVEWLGP